MDSIAFQKMPQFQGNNLFVDYSKGSGSAYDFFSHHPHDFSSALQARENIRFNREAAADGLSVLNKSFGAHANALSNIEALRNPSTFCVITGQQVGFFGGPVYTAYKIVTAIRLAEELTEKLNVRCIPVFWGASEDHDFHEINHVHLAKDDGEIGRRAFLWENIGNSVYDLPLDDKIRQTALQYLRDVHIGQPFCGEMIESFRPRREASYTDWIYAIFTRLFSEQGLVIADPRTIRPFMGDFFKEVLEKREGIRGALKSDGTALQKAGYRSLLDHNKAGSLYTYDNLGKRTRVDSLEQPSGLAEHPPESLSSDVALRPLLADSALPVIVNVLGPGEIEYTAQLKGLYRLFDMPQPLIFPRKSYTVLSREDRDLIKSCGTDITEILNGDATPGSLYEKRFDLGVQSIFDDARDKLRSALSPLSDYVKTVDPNLSKTYDRTLESSLYQIRRLEERTHRAMLSTQGFSKKTLRSLLNTILPMGKLQERIIPLPHYIAAFGTDFLSTIKRSGALTDFSHHIVYI
jgi:bacillithiol synthase